MADRQGLARIGDNGGRMLRETLLIAATAASLSIATAAPDRVRLLEGRLASALTPEELNEEVTGYLPKGSIDVAAVLQPPPAIDTPADKADVALFRELTSRVSAERWERALADDASVYDRFEKQLGFKPDRRRMPRFVRLLNRVAEDVSAATADAKQRFTRARPFQRLAVSRACGQSSLPKPDAAAGNGTSYPSGHAALSWATALVMIEAAPQSAEAIVLRAVDYGQSRVVCNAHFPVDVQAGQILATAVVDKLFANADFRKDFTCAKKELQAVAAGMRAEDLPACQ